MATKAHSQHGSVPVAKLLAVESQVGKLTSEMEKLILISTQHGMRIKELIVASSNSVSQVEMMSTVTTSRFQHMNDLKALKGSLQAKYEGSGGGASTFSTEADSKDSKNVDPSKLFEIQNEVSNASFKTNMEMNKLKMELKASKKEYEDLKRFVTVMETKLTVFIQDAKDSGINTSIEMNDMPEIARTSAPRRASILATDGVTVGFGGHHPQLGHSASDGGQGGHFPGGYPGPGQYAGTFPGPFPGSPGHFPSHFPGFPGQPGQFPMFPHFPSFPAHPAGAPHSHSHPHTPFTPNKERILEEGEEHFPLPIVASSPSHPNATPAPVMEPAQIQQLQLLYQQHVYHQHHMYMQHQHAVHSGMPQPMTDSGMSTPAGTATGPRPTFTGDHHGAAGGNPAIAAALTHAPDSWQSVAHRIIHPHQQTFPGGHAPYNPFGYNPYGDLFSHTQPAMSAEDPEAALIASLAGPSLSKEERYYKNQYRAMKELILATMECKDISQFEADGSHLLNAIPSTAQAQAPQAPATAEAKISSPANISVGAKDTKDSINSVENKGDASAATQEVPAVSAEDLEMRRIEAEELLKKRVTMHLRHQNRDLFRNMRRVKEIEGVAVNYAEFCVNNAVNTIDGAAYDKFKDILMCSELSRFHAKQLTQSTVEVQTDDYNPLTSNTSEKDHRRSSVAQSASNRRRSSNKVRINENSSGSGDVGFRARARSRGDSFGSQSDGEASRGNSASGSRGGTGGLGGAGSPALEPPKPMLLTLQELREAHEEDSEADDIADIIEMELASTAAPLDFGDAIAPAQFSSKGRKATICEFSGKLLRDPALDFLDTSFEELGDEGSFSDTSPQPVSRASSFRQSSFRSNVDTAYYGVDAVPSSSRPATATTTAGAADIAQLKASMTALMDKKLMKLYQGLDERWKGLDQTNVGILQKLRKFQDVIVNMNEDSQRLLSSNQVLAGRIAKLDGRLFEALEPMYIALETHKESTERLEGLMMELSKSIQQQQHASSLGRTIERPVWRDGEAPDMKTAMAAMKPEQLPIETILRNSHAHNQPHQPHQPGHTKTHGPGATMNSTARSGAHHNTHNSGAMNSAEYDVLELSESRPAHLMSEHELDEVLRQLKQYAGMYEDMMQNYQSIIKRLKEEDVRRSGNFSLKKPHLTGTRPVHTPSHAIYRPPNNQQSEDLATTAAAVGAPELLVPHPPGRVVVHVPLTSENHDNTDSPGMNSACNTDADGEINKVNANANANAAFFSPQRVLYQGAEPASPLPVHNNSHANSASGKQFPLSKKDILALLERSDLSSNIEIVRIKNELARLKNSLSGRRTPSPTNRQRGQAPPTTFPSLFSTLGAADFAVLRNQSASPSGASLRANGPPGGAGFRPSSPRNAVPGPGSAGGGTSASVLPALAVLNSPVQQRKTRPQMQDSLDELSGDVPGLVPQHDSERHRQDVPQSELPPSRTASGTSLLLPHSPGPDDGVLPQDDYVVGGVLDDENGLDEQSLSAYEYLTHPHTSHSQSVLLGETDPFEPVPVPEIAKQSAGGGAEATKQQTVVGDKIVEAGASVSKPKPPIEIVYATEATAPTVNASNLMNTTVGGASGSTGVSTTTRWGSSTAIRSTAIAPKTVSSLTASPARLANNPLLSPQPADSTAAAGAGAAGAPRGTSASGKVRKTLAPGAATSAAQARLENKSREYGDRADPVRKIDVLMRADAIINGDIAPFSAVGSVKTGPVPVPTPPVKARPVANSTSTPRKIVEKSVERSVDRRDVASAERDAKVWQRDYTSMESIGSTVASVPSILLQGGEFVSNYDASLVAGAGSGVAYMDGHIYVKGTGGLEQVGSVDSLPLNLSRNLGENAFD